MSVVYQLDQYTSIELDASAETLITIDFTSGGFGDIADLSTLDYDDTMPVCQTSTDPLMVANPGFNGNDFEDLHIWWMHTGMSLTVTEAMMRDTYVTYAEVVTGYPDFCGTYIEGDLEVFKPDSPVDGIFRSTSVMDDAAGMGFTDTTIGATFTEGADGGTIEFTLTDFYPGRYALGRKLTRSDGTEVGFNPVFHFLIAEECGLSTETPATTTLENLDPYTSAKFDTFTTAAEYEGSDTGGSYTMLVYPLDNPTDMIQSVTIPGQVATCGAMLQTRSLKINSYGISSIAEQWMYAGKTVRSSGFEDDSVSITVVNQQGYTPDFTLLELQVNSYFIHDSTSGVTWSQEDQDSDNVDFNIKVDYCLVGNTLSIATANDNGADVVYYYD